MDTLETTVFVQNTKVNFAKILIGFWFVQSLFLRQDFTIHDIWLYTNISMYMLIMIFLILFSYGRSLVRVLVGSNQRLWNWYFLHLHKECSINMIKEQEQTGWIGIRIMCQEWSDMSTHEILFQWASPIKILNKHFDLVQSRNHHLIEM
jgi:hypothetical protein